MEIPVQTSRAERETFASPENAVFGGDQTEEEDKLSGATFTPKYYGLTSMERYYNSVPFDEVFVFFSTNCIIVVRLD